MNNTVLMNLKEPDDNVLLFLMQEVAKEAKSKALITRQQLAGKVKQLIQKASEKK